MESILFLAHVDDENALPRTALESLTTAIELAASLAGTLTVALFGAEVQSAANSIATCGATRFLGVSGLEYAQPRYATDAAACEALCRAANATIVVAPATSRLARVLPGVTHRLNGHVDTHITGVSLSEGNPVATRWFYRQRIEASLQRTDRPWLLLLESGSRPAWQGKDSTVNVEIIAVTLPSIRTVVKGIRAPKAGEQTIRPDSKLLFVAGAGWTKKQADGQPHPAEAEQLILGFLRESQASLGGSKSLVEQSGENQATLRFMTHLNQVGQTGATPRHPKGLSTCCHGEEPHVVGWRFITERRAINLDPNCGWARGKADVVYVADAFVVLSKVNALLTKRSAAVSGD
ncbi:MAG: electron transfer flavoprotein subunit alpha/FixB family protein [Terriglobales bacterium]